MAVLIYALVGYASFLGVMTGLVVWLRWLQMPLPVAPLGPSLAIDLLLLLLFAVQHTVMARAPFKAWIQQRLTPAAERPTYVIASNLALGLMMMCWQRLPGVVWWLDGTVAWALLAVAALGWIIAVAATFQFDHWTLFGVRQAWEHWRGTSTPRAEEGFAVPLLYRWVRHPMMTGTLLAFWVTPQFSVDRLVLALGFSLYIVVGMQFEERSLRTRFGQVYVDYARRTPALLPWPRRSVPGSPAASSVVSID